MLNRLRVPLLGLGRRLAGVGSGFVETFLRDNKVIPVVLALLALFVFAWVVAGTFFGGTDEEPVSNRAEVAQIQDPGTADPPAPEVENRDVDSYAAYQFKDPFRQIVAPAETTTDTTPANTTTPTTTPAPTTTPINPPADEVQDDAGRGGGDILDGSDSDGDGLSDRREFDLGLDPANPDSDGDGTLDGQDDEARGGAGSGGAGRGDAGDDDDPGAGGGGGGRAGQNGDLPESGGEIPLP